MAAINDKSIRIISPRSKLMGSVFKTLSLTSDPRFTVNIGEKIIHVRRKLRRQVDKFLPEALEKFSGKVYLKLDPFGFGTELFCYRDENEKIQIVVYDRDAGWGEEGKLKVLETIEKIKYNSNYTEIEVWLDLE
jgi:hypothetical protein